MKVWRKLKAASKGTPLVSDLRNLQTLILRVCAQLQTKYILGK